MSASGADPTRPGLLIIDADQTRANRLARALTLADFRPIVTMTLYDALRRLLTEPGDVQALVLGHVDWELSASDLLLSRLAQRLASGSKGHVPALVLPSRTLTPPGLLASEGVMIVALPSSEQEAVLDAIWTALPHTRYNTVPDEQARTLTLLRSEGLTPRDAAALRSSNAHCRLALQAALDLIGSERWESLMTDVGLAQYSHIEGWPADDHVRSIPAEVLSCLNQAVERTHPQDPVAQLRRWGEKIAQATLAKRGRLGITQQALRLLPTGRVIGLAFDAFTAELNDVRGAALHRWQRRPDGSYWIVHYYNLFAFGRARRTQPACHVWIGALHEILRDVHQDTASGLEELECGCQTQTNHCLFALTPR